MKKEDEKRKKLSPDSIRKNREEKRRRKRKRKRGERREIIEGRYISTLIDENTTYKYIDCSYNNKISSCSGGQQHSWCARDARFEPCLLHKSCFFEYIRSVRYTDGMYILIP